MPGKVSRISFGTLPGGVSCPASQTSTRLALRGYAEWQHAGSESGLWAQASFVGADSWSPLYGEGFARTSGLFGLGLDALLSPRAALSFGYDRRAGAAFADRQWSAKLRYGF